MLIEKSHYHKSVEMLYFGYTVGGEDEYESLKKWTPKTGITYLAALNKSQFLFWEPRLLEKGFRLVRKEFENPLTMNLIRVYVRDHVE